MGTTEKPIHMDAVVAETMGCVNLTDMMLHVIEIKISENDLKRDHKMQEYARCADYMWLAVPSPICDRPTGSLPPFGRMNCYYYNRKRFATV